MTNPIVVAARGKGFLPMLIRGGVIASRYGFTPEKIEISFKALIDTIRKFKVPVTIPVTASALAANPTAVSRYAVQRLEWAIHGLHHLDYSLMTHDHQVTHLSQARAIFDHLGVQVSGFRSPYLRWNAETLTALIQTGFRYDSSQAIAWDLVGGKSTVSYRRALDFYRAQSLNDFPALPSWAGELVRIPYALPDDEALVDRFRITNSEAMAEIWLAMLDRAYQAEELFTLGLHPERAILCQPALEAVLKMASSLSPPVWVTRLDEIADWFRSLGETEFELRQDGDNLFYIKISAPIRATILARNLEVRAETIPWTAGYQEVLANEFAFRSEKRPIIGLAPGSPVSLRRFLRHLGYLAESSADSGAYSIYLDARSFSPEDERPLLTRLESSSQPFVRISRWPGTARCCLAITGDLDAFAIWDYGRRILAS